MVTRPRPSPCRPLRPVRSQRPGAWSTPAIPSTRSITSTRRTGDREAPRREVELRRIRNVAGMTLLEDPPSDPQYPAASEAPAPDPESRLPEITPAELTPELLRGGDTELRRPAGPRAHGSREGRADGRRHRPLLRDSQAGAGRAPDADGYYDELEPEPPFIIGERSWIEEGGGVLAVDSPRLLFDMLESFEEAGPAQRHRGLPRGAAGDLGAEVHAPQGDARRHRRVASGRCLPRRRPRPQRLALALALRRRGAEHGRGAPAARRLRARPGRRARTSTSRSPRRWPRRPPARSGSSGRSSTRATHSSSTTSSSTRPAPIRRCRTPRYAIESWFFGPSAYPGKLRADRLLSGS